ncbi:uncharacterized protein BX663DRAFT_550340 [Cokeromyces recurvatus]|uniref:uncharacterized protein n=1 Tax=Cokeromyces recurvatus TaxID=90255 RepID=UPI00221FB96F|nr:uncharacterized protein BX663DRAFT_550340 [Cokeromyces recurvatus]KAI7904696.1 hypothetical protein BX663DRAFT_550340 [Cokeromyces recurvatus]
MQQQQIQERNASFALLNKAETLCNTWHRIQSKSLLLLQSISNIIAQRYAVLDQMSTLEIHDVNPSRLMFKQTESMENSIANLYSTLDLFEKVTDDWYRLEHEAIRHVSKSLNQPFLTKPQPISTHSLIQVTAVTPAQTHDIISRLSYMYKNEFTHKVTLLSSLSSSVSTQRQIQTLIDCWNLESNIDSSIETEMVERIKLYKTVKKVLESVD